MEIIWSDMALHQLDGILDYVEEHFGASVSRKTLDDIDSKVGRLLLFPESGTPDYSYSSKLLNNKVLIRHLNIGPNVVYYNIDGEIINIMVIAHYKQSTVVKTIEGLGSGIRTPSSQRGTGESKNLRSSVQSVGQC